VIQSDPSRNRKLGPDDDGWDRGLEGCDVNNCRVRRLRRRSLATIRRCSVPATGMVPILAAGHLLRVRAHGTVNTRRPRRPTEGHKSEGRQDVSTPGTHPNDCPSGTHGCQPASRLLTATESSAELALAKDNPTIRRLSKDMVTALE